jgi:uncharacterized repeat protein (TIGR03803 family)
MRLLRLAAAVCCGGILAGCSHMGGSSSLPSAGEGIGSAVRPLSGNGWNFKMLYKWTGGNDGGGPFAGLTNVSGVLYGTTYASWSSQWHGTVFKFTPAGNKLAVLYRFTGGKDGEKPFAGLTYLGGTLYGTTQNGGKHACGTVFSIAPSGKPEKSIYSFRCAPKDGDYPRSDLTDVNGTLYGTTFEGGPIDLGTVYSITPAGTEKMIHGFHGTDGSRPVGALLDVGGTLYGTTSSGGKYDNGTVYKIDTSGKESPIYAFKGGTDGMAPYGGLVAVGGVLYGTTRYGGTGTKGTLYKVTTSGAETVLHSFKGGSDGAAPEAALIDIGGTLYGTTVFGGPNDKGTVFESTTSGKIQVLYSFKGGLEGFGPVAGLTDVNGTLYGDTTWGGQTQDNYSCCGIIYSLSR